MLEMKCPVTGKSSTSKTEYNCKKKHWFPNNLDLSMLSHGCDKNSPMSKDFNYVDEFDKLDYKGLKEDLYKLMTDSQDWWPADYGNYGPFFIRMSWHSAGTYRKKWDAKPPTNIPGHNKFVSKILNTYEHRPILIKALREAEK